MNRRTAQLLERVAATRPVPPHATHQVAGEPARRAMFERIIAAPVRPLRRPQRRAVSRLFPYAVAGATFAVVAALAVGLLPGRGPGGAPPASALELAARTAAAQPYRVPGPGERWYARAVTDIPVDHAHGVAETWIDRDGNAWTRTRLDAPGVHETSPITPTTWQHEAARNPMSFKEVRDLPTDQAALRARLQAAATRLPKELDLLDPVPMLALTSLGHPGLRPEQRAALFRLVASSPRVGAVRATTDPRGRPVLAVRVVDRPDPDDPQDPGADLEFMFSRDTSQLVATIARAAGDNTPGARRGQVVASAVGDEWTIVPAPRG